MAAGRIPNNGTAAIQSTIVTTKGDILAATSASAISRLAVGATNGMVLTVDSSEATGLKYATPSGSSGPAFFAYRSSSDQSITTATSTKIQFNAESFDTANCFDSTTNYRFTPTTSGYYQLNLTTDGAGSTITRAIYSFYKNGAEYVRYTDSNGSYTDWSLSGSTLMYFNGTTDYAEGYVYMTGSSLILRNLSNLTNFSGVWIRS